MSLIHQVKSLIAKELILEWRSRYAFNGIVLYVVSTIFVCYLSFKGGIQGPTWNVLFWIILLFASINALVKSFVSYPISHKRMDKSGSSPGWILPNPFEASKAFFDIPIHSFISRNPRTGDLCRIFKVVGEFPDYVFHNQAIFKGRQLQIPFIIFAECILGQIAAADDKGLVFLFLENISLCMKIAISGYFQFNILKFQKHFQGVRLCEVLILRG